MSDILCERCGEPWDLASLNDDMSPEEARKFRAGKGCPCCSDKRLCPELNQLSCEDCEDWDWKHHKCFGGYFKPIADDARHIQSALHSILGDDLDGLSAEMEDLGFV